MSVLRFMELPDPVAFPIGCESRPEGRPALAGKVEYGSPLGLRCPALPEREGKDGADGGARHDDEPDHGTGTERRRA